MEYPFIDFWHLYAPDKQFFNRYRACERLWAAKSERDRSLILRELQNEQYERSPPVHTKNPYFYLIDWQPPQPHWLRGDEEGDLVQVKYNGRYKICTRADMELYGLEWVRDW
ncbi:MAG: hypothetical protein IKM83_06265 [Paludibacteraceae bacterium]|nr:hypothetical protein [Paludibacteraceae bacterium]